MCYKVSQRNGSVFRIRPNRTLRTHRKFSRLMALLMSHLTLAAVATVTPVVCLLINLSIFNDWRYMRKYPNCDRHLEALG